MTAASPTAAAPAPGTAAPAEQFHSSQQRLNSVCRERLCKSGRRLPVKLVLSAAEDASCLVLVVGAGLLCRRAQPPAGARRRQQLAAPVVQPRAASVLPHQGQHPGARLARAVDALQGSGRDIAEPCWAAVLSKAPYPDLSASAPAQHDPKRRHTRCDQEPYLAGRIGCGTYLGQTHLLQA